ncbi:MAG: hypothetical protein ABTD50_24565 [Polyangiaceae bacterium]|jgi:hypothetical protein
MSSTQAIAVGACLATLLGAGAAACIDIFHSTDGLRSACEIDPSTFGCGAGLCMPRAEAQAVATRACAWLGACEGPIGRNAFGDCAVEARLAYDCAANPNHPIKGQAGQLWACLAQAGSCADVDDCILPTGFPGCAEIGNGCAGAEDGGLPSTVRIECAETPMSDAGGYEIVDGAPRRTAYAEDCALFGQICSIVGGEAICTGGAGADGCSGVAEGCPEKGSNALVWCGANGIDLGLDCTSNGAQECNGYPTSAQAQWVACVPEGDTSCPSPSLTVQCDGGVATSCPTGVAETIDCTALLGVAGACVSGALDPPFDWTSPCRVTVPQCSTDGCDDAGNLLGCMRGATITVDCQELGLGPCMPVELDAGVTSAACTGG